MNEWKSISERPAVAGTYTVSLFTGVIRTAYWTGEKWVGAEKGAGRTNNARHLNKLLRHWKTQEVSQGNSAEK